MSGRVDGFANSLCVCSIMLIGFEIGLDGLRGHQLDIMAHRHEFTGPKVGRSIDLHVDQTWGDVGKKGKHFCSFELLVKQPLAVFVNSVDLENLFCQIDAGSLNVHDGRSAQIMTIYRPTVAQEVGGNHSINKAPYICRSPNQGD